VSGVPSPDRAVGIFETLLIVDGSPIELEAHLERLRRSLRELFRAEVPAEAREQVLEHAAPLELGRLRLTVAPQPSGELAAGTVTAPVDPGDVFPAWERASTLEPLLVPGGLGAHKWADRAAVAAAEVAGIADRRLPLLLDAEQEVLEASRANVFIVEDGALVTPATDGRILPGVARARTLETARTLGIECREQALTLERVLGAGEAFLTGSVRGVEPVRAVGEAELRAPGELVFELAAELERIWIGEGAARWVNTR
jgi:para-aminobenzoate synthetase / 4-amino-4-deoxychorismate lyase